MLATFTTIYVKPLRNLLHSAEEPLNLGQEESESPVIDENIISY